MKSKTKRRISRTWKDIGGVFSILSICTLIVTVIVTPLLALSGRVLLSWSLAIVWIILAIILYLVQRKLSTHETKFFEEVDFREPNEDVILGAVEGILNTQKTVPSWVHVAPQFAEVDSMCSQLRERGFVTVSGPSGSGKSMAAYQAGFVIKAKEKHKIYRLRVEDFRSKTKMEFGQIKDKMLYELDGLKGNGKKLILVDDAHTLTTRDELLNTLQKETKEGNGKLIWVETEFPEMGSGEVQQDDCIRLQLVNSYDKLLNEFYSNEDPILRKILTQRTKGLNDASDRFRKGKIRDIWHFNFCATQGWETLAEQISQLNNLSLLVLFFTSSHAVLSGEKEIHSNEILNKIRSLESTPRLNSQFQWLSEYGSVRMHLKNWQEGN